MTQIMSVTGPIDANQMGETLIHEHIFIDLMKDSWSGNNLLNDPDLAVVELGYFKAAGGSTVIDQTNRGLFPPDLLPGPFPLAVKQVAEQTGLNIVLGCGWYREPYYEPYLYRWKTDQVAEQMIQDIEAGIDGTGVRPGFIGEIGAHFTWISPVEERMFRAAARAHKRTGLTVTTHATRSPVGLDQLDILQEEGVDPRRVVISHAQSYPYFEYHAELARRGAYMSFDRMGMRAEHIRRRNLRMIKALIDAGWLKHIMLSQDVCYQSDLVAYGGAGYACCSVEIRPLLREIGIGDEEYHQMQVENPRRALTGEA